ncbi:uncharacterized protein TRUGW13939_05074, partial [Talaromyces rugulosus]
MALLAPEQGIQVDTSDVESLYDEESVLESSKSIVSSVYDYLWENGRRYHAYRQGQYPFPNDEREQDRLDLMHCLWKDLLNGSLYRAPLHELEVQRILDFGTGTANWAFDVAELFPRAEVLGTDLSPIQPIWSPANCKFFVDDVESEWAYSSLEAFDFIHGRAMGGSVSDWPQLLRRIHTHLKPGGWVELQEFECMVTSDDGTHQGVNELRDWCSTVDEASVRFGRQIGVAAVLREKLENAGFVDVVDDFYKCPIGPWPRDERLKHIGRVHLACCLEGFEPYSLALFTRILGFSYDKFQAYIHDVKKAALNPDNHLYVGFHFVYGRKRRLDETCHGIMWQTKGRPAGTSILTSSSFGRNINIEVLPKKAGCKLCNIWFSHQGNAWPSRFRALYRSQDGEIKLSEVAALREEDKCMILDEENGEWNTANLGLLTGEQYKPAANKSNCCYLFHELCWDRVIDHFCPDELDLVSLHKALLHFALKGRSIHGHFYRQAGKLEVYSDEESDGDDNFDPFLLKPTIKQIMRRRIKKPPFLRPKNSIKDSIGNSVNKTDPFAALPAEVRQILAIHLATQDFFALRSASRSIAPLFESTTFWQSRFFIGGEYGYLYHAIREFTSVKRNDKLDWRGLYIRMQKLEYTPQLDFQACVWDSLRQLKSATREFRSSTAKVSQCGHYHNYPISCVKNTHKESIKFGQAEKLRCVEISMVKIGYEAYVTGLIFIFDDQKSVWIGHLLPGIENSNPWLPGTLAFTSHFAYPGHCVVSAHMDNFLGLSFCKDSNGIHSMTIINRDDRPRCIASCLQNTTANSTDLILDKVTEIIVTLDHCKVIDLEIRGPAGKPKKDEEISI